MKKKWRLVAVPLSLIFILSILPIYLAQASIDWWSLPRHDLAQTGYTTSTGPNTNQILWTAQIGSGPLYCPPVVDMDRLYIGTNDGNQGSRSGLVYCIDATSGLTKWSNRVGADSIGAMATANGKLYINTIDGLVFCLNSSTGSQIWSNQIASKPRGISVYSDRLYITSENTNLYCVNASTGNTLWTYKTDGILKTYPAVADDKIIFGSYDKYIYCINSTNGNQLWSYKTGDILWSYFPAISDGKVYEGAQDKNIYCLNATDGTLVWKYLTDGTLGSPAIAYGKVFVGSSDTNVYCFDALNGSKLWNYATNGDAGAPAIAPAIAENKVFIGSYDGYFYCLNATTGSKVWSYQTTATTSCAPTIANGIVYVGTTSGKLYAFGTLAPSPTPVSGDIYVDDTLSSGYNIGVDSSDHLTDWLSSVNNSLCMSYPSGQTWGAVFITVGPPVDLSRPSLDFTQYKYVSFELKGAVGHEPVQFGLKDFSDPDDGTETRVSISNVSTKWQTYNYPLSAFTTANAAKLYVVAEFVFSGLSPETVCFRNIKYVSSPVPTPTPAPTATPTPKPSVSPTPTAVPSPKTTATPTPTSIISPTPTPIVPELTTAATLSAITILTLTLISIKRTKTKEHIQN